MEFYTLRIAVVMYPMTYRKTFVYKLKKCSKIYGKESRTEKVKKEYIKGNKK